MLTIIVYQRGRRVHEDIFRAALPLASLQPGLIAYPSGNILQVKAGKEAQI